ncbi:MAG: hypothetical protein JNN15_07085 [Blastocatellia bacterium]|nr:hypothetical protein [Blastocatellia bacterium]
MTRFLQILFLAITNPFYNLGLFVWEGFSFGRYLWWWRLRLAFLFFYLSESPYAVIKREGFRAPVTMDNLVYGETPCLTLKKILEKAKISSSDHFVDLGCGRGLSVMFVRMFFNIPSTGIELLPTFVEKAKKIARRLSVDKVDFIRENLAWITEAETRQGTVFYLAGTAFNDELWAKVVLRLELLPKGVKVITLSEEIASEKFRIDSVEEFYFSWGKTEVYFQEKIV